jgi:hypothetical protein
MANVTLIRALYDLSVCSALANFCSTAESAAKA